MRGKFTGFHKLVILLIVILTFFMRPFVFGLDSKIALIPLFLLGLLLLTLPQTNKNIIKNIKILSFFYFVFFVGLMISDPGVTVLNCIPYIGEIVLAFLICHNIKAMRYYFKYLKNVFILLIISAIITFILGFFYDLDTLKVIRDLSYTDGEYNFSLYFPLSWSQNLWYIGDYTFAREYFFFVEPGMVPAFFTAFIYIIIHSSEVKHKKLQISLFVIGILLTFSTGGPLILLSSCAIYYLAKNYSNLSLKKICVAAIFLGIAWYAFNYMPFFGKEAKVGLSDASSEAVDIHKSVLQSYVLIATFIMWACGFFLGLYKNNRQVSWTIAFLMGLGYLSNYIGYTTLTTLFLLWDQSEEEVQRYRASLKK